LHVLHGRLIIVVHVQLVNDGLDYFSVIQIKYYSFL